MENKRRFLYSFLMGAPDTLKSGDMRVSSLDPQVSVRRISGRGYLGTAGVCATILGMGLFTPRYGLDLATTVPLYLLLVLLVAWRVGFRAAVAVSVCSTLCLDYFFTEPRFTLRVVSVQDVLALLSFACVSLLVSHLSHRVSAHAEALRVQERQQQALHEVARSAALLDWKAPVGSQLCSMVRESFGVGGIGLWDARENVFSCAGNAGDTADTVRAAYLAKRDYDLQGQGVDLQSQGMDLWGSRGRPQRHGPRHGRASIRLLRFGARPVGAVLFRDHGLDPTTASALAALIASTMERARALRAEVLAESAKVSEQLRAAVLDGLAHAIKTPLTTIGISGAGILELGELSPVQRSLAETIGEQVTFLSAMTDKLLRTSRLGTDEIVLQRRALDLRVLCLTVIQNALLEGEAARIHTRFAEEPVPLEGDPDLLRMALAQLLENALKYSPSASPVVVSAEVANGAVSVSVHNEGSFIPQAERALIFERFYRSPAVERGAPGTGIGLSVARRAVEAHDGTVAVESDRSTGTTFFITLPLRAVEEVPIIHRGKEEPTSAAKAGQIPRDLRHG